MVEKNTDTQNNRAANPSGEGKVNISADINLQPVTEAQHDLGSTIAVREQVVARVDTDTIDLAQGINGKNTSKKIGNKNALKYGLHSKHIILPGERSEDFDDLLDDLRAEHHPEGCTEELIVLSLAKCMWLEIRAMKAAQLRLLKADVPEELKTGELTYEDMVSHQEAVPKQVRGALDAVKGLIEGLDTVFEHIRSRPYWTDTADGKHVQSQLMVLQNDMVRLSGQVKGTVAEGVQQLVDMMKESTTRLDKAYQPEEIEKDLDRMAKVDRHRHKLLASLAGTKEYKRSLGLKPSSRLSLESPAMVPDGGSSKDLKQIEETGVQSTCGSTKPHKD
jgi:hypothetical protein